MDFERASIKALFYDYPVETAVKAIEQSWNSKDDYLDILPQLVRWREDAFTTTEARLMENMAQDIWMHLAEDDMSCGKQGERSVVKIPFIYRPFLLVKHMANKLLEYDPYTMQPIVKFDELLRWKDVTLFLGEDLLTTAYMANRDISTEYKRQTNIFNWQDRIPHNNKELNEVLSRGVTDIHAHYNATADVFSLNWITLMNSMSQINEQSKKIKSYQDVTLSTADTEQMYSYKRMCIAATFLRLQFFKYFNGVEGALDDLCRVKRILEDEITATNAKTDLSVEISLMRLTALHGSNGRVIDYAIQPDEYVKTYKKDANLIFHGERKLMYQFFQRFYINDSRIWAVAPCFYLYLLLKTRIRKEFVQINQLKGFENFETYQDRKNLFIADDSPIGQLYDALMLQTTISHNTNNKVEGRVTPKELRDMINKSRLRANRYRKGIFTPTQVITKPNENLSIVVHFIKANYSKSDKAKDLRLNNRQDFARYSKYRKDLKEHINLVLNRFREQPSSDVQVVGIDAASTEMFCRPEVFGHVFRYARKKGLVNQTYHVGEDFFDIVDGLRAIDEALMFLGLDSHCRIGHALAMGINAEQYYKRRRFRFLAPQQYVLDNCVWLCMTASQKDVEIPNSLETQLNKWANHLYKAIGYEKFGGGQFDINTYWNSMLLRGDEPNRLYCPKETSNAEYSIETEWQQTEQIDNPQVNMARQDEKARGLYILYHYNKRIKEEGERRFQDTYLESIYKVVDALQEKMRRKVAAKQIAVECNPTSNLKIGFIDNYCEHPLLTKFDPIDKQTDVHYPLLNASVNTDDRGVFATTLYNEFSLLALAMMKQKNKDTGEPEYGTRQIMDYIEHLRRAGEQQRFKVG